MPIDPQIEAMLADRPKSPGARHIPLNMFRQAVRNSALSLPLAPDAVVARIATTAHAVHGAIDISEEHDLQPLTRRLHEWCFAD